MGFVILRVSTEIHWADNLLNERNLISSDAVFGVEFLVRPLPVPLLGWYEGIYPACCVLGWLVQKDQETSQSAGKIGEGAFSLIP